MSWEVIHRPEDAEDAKVLQPISVPQTGESLTARQARDLALEFARFGLATVAPNPPVGAVVLDRNNGFLGAGCHEAYGGPHAEIRAIQDVLDRHDGNEAVLEGATLYVTLEPCAHTGKTPPCSKELVRRKFGRVFYGSRDPNPCVDGRGAEILEAGGVRAELLEDWQADCEEVARAFHCSFRNQRPLVGLKAAMSTDGSIGREGDQRVFLTGKRARAYGHYLRAVYDGIVVGRKTLEADRPALDIRDVLHSELQARAPRKIVLDPGAKAADILQNHWKDSKEEVIWCVAQGAAGAQLSRDNLTILEVRQHLDADVFDLRDLLSQLHSRGLQSILLEGGSGVYRTFMDEGLVDRLHLFMAPKVLGGTTRLPWMVNGKEQDWSLEACRLTVLEEDLLLEGRAARKMG